MFVCFGLPTPPKRGDEATIRAETEGLFDARPICVFLKTNMNDWKNKHE